MRLRCIRPLGRPYCQLKVRSPASCQGPRARRSLTPPLQLRTHAARAYQSGSPPALLVHRGSISRSHTAALTQPDKPRTCSPHAPRRHVEIHSDRSLTRVSSQQTKYDAHARYVYAHSPPCQIPSTTSAPAPAPAICQLSHPISTMSTIATATCGRAHRRRPAHLQHIKVSTDSMRRCRDQTLSTHLPVNADDFTARR